MQTLKPQAANGSKEPKAVIQKSPESEAVGKVIVKGQLVQGPAAKNALTHQKACLILFERAASGLVRLKPFYIGQFGE